MCTESLTARRASVHCHDGRALRQLLLVDDRYIVSSNPYVDGDINVQMRTQLAEWIYQVTRPRYDRGCWVNTWWVGLSLNKTHIPQLHLHVTETVPINTHTQRQ